MTGAKHTVDKDSLDLAAKVQKAQENPKFINLSSGVVLELIEDVGPMVFIDIMGVASAGCPKPPSIYLKDLGRYEENPDDPDYRTKLNLWKAAYSGQLTDAMIVFGTKINKVPKGVDKPDDDGWLNKLRAAGLTIDLSNPEARYLAWVKRIAIKTAEDMQVISASVGAKAGISEEDVAAATESFPD